MVPNGFVEATWVYECIWCKRTDTVKHVDGNTDLSPITSWVWDYQVNGKTLCSSDCQAEKIQAEREAYGELPSRGADMMPDGYYELVEKKRLAKMKERVKKWL